MTTILISWLNGISALLLVSASWYFVIVCIYYYRKLHIKTYLGGLLLFTAIGLGWMGITLSFLSISFTGTNLPWVIFIVPFFSYSTIPLGCFGIIYIVWELVGSKKSKKIIYSLYVILFIAYYILLYVWWEVNVVTNFDLGAPTTDLMDDWIHPERYFFYFIWLLVMITSIITLLGFGKMRSHTTGELKTRSSLLLLATPLVALGILADTVVLGSLPLLFVSYPIHLDFLYIIRLMMILGIFFILIAFRPDSMKPILAIIPILIIIFGVFFFFWGPI